MSLDSRMDTEKNLRILVVDDNPSIHADFRKILQPAMGGERELRNLRSSLFGEDAKDAPVRSYEVDTAIQGEDGYQRVRVAAEAGRPYAVAFVDMRMPPGWDGVETIEHMWTVDADLQVVISTAYSDQSWEDIVRRLGVTDRLLILKKPFDSAEIRQLATTLTEKWDLARKARLQVEELARRVEEKTRDLAQVNSTLQTKVEEISRAEEMARRWASALESANHALEEASSAAGAANRAKSEFLSNMSHEIRTPMAAILGYADLLCEPDLPREELALHVQTIRRNGEHLLRLINDILDISKIEAGAMTTERLPCSPAAILSEVADLMGLRAAEKGITLGFGGLGPVPETIRSDPTRVRQILLNLVGNAVKFTERGSIRVLARLVPEKEGRGPWLAFDVVDTGIGLTAEQQERLFRPFSQADTSTTRRYGGSGLGLNISLRLAELLGGSLAVRSAPGQGSTFTASVETGPLDGIRRVELENVLESRPARTESLPASGPSIQGRILLAEDGRDNQRLIKLYVTRAGGTIEIVDDGCEACVAALHARDAGTPFDLILMDMQMPRMDGYEATRELRARGYRGPIVALTAHAMSGDRERCLSAGCDDYTTKPIDRVRLLEICARLIARGAAPAPALPSRPASSNGAPLADPTGRLNGVEPGEAVDTEKPTSA